jgi:hypothetical protein
MSIITHKYQLHGKMMVKNYTHGAPIMGRRHWNALVKVVFIVLCIGLLSFLSKVERQTVRSA